MGKGTFSRLRASCLFTASFFLAAASAGAAAHQIIDIDSDAAIDYYERHFDSQGFSRDGTRDGCTPSYEYDSDGKSRGKRTWSTDDAACPPPRSPEGGTVAPEPPRRGYGCAEGHDHHRHHRHHD